RGRLSASTFASVESGIPTFSLISRNVHSFCWRTRRIKCPSVLCAFAFTFECLTRAFFIPSSRDFASHRVDRSLSWSCIRVRCPGCLYSTQRAGRRCPRRVYGPSITAFRPFVIIFMPQAETELVLHLI